MGREERVYSHEINISDDATNKHEKFCFINTNARSLYPKTDSLIDYFNELDTVLGVVTETWLHGGDTTDRYVQDLQDRAGLSAIYRSRPAGVRGLVHGGVAILAKDNRARLAPIKLHNPAGYEVLG